MDSSFLCCWIGLENLANPHLSPSGKKTDIFTDKRFRSTDADD
ncbi:MAG: hypothetical protein Ct9H300mP11_32320 [Chloroflexota bacterium]|nr:MAG: hypothetical protein Ct9H300mP11_32320 [Chloroflexota bacterium]